MKMLAVDLGGTQLRVAVVDAQGSVLARSVRPTRQGPDGPAELVAHMRELAAGCAYAVVGVPGRVDHRAGRLDHAPNLDPRWTPALTEAALADAVGLPVHLANDADLAAVGEARFGAGRGFEDVVFLTFSTGVGAGVLLGGKLLRGRRSAAEVGHVILDEGAFARGMPATFEERASGTGLARVAAWLGIAGSGAEIVATEDPRAKAALEMTIAAACVGVRNVAFCFSPEIVVIGGGFGLLGERLWTPLREHLRAYGPPGLDIEVRGAALGDAAGLVGAAAWRAATC